MSRIVQNLKFKGRTGNAEVTYLKCTSGRLMWEDVREEMQSAFDLWVRGGEDCRNFQIWICVCAWGEDRKISTKITNMLDYKHERWTFRAVSTKHFLVQNSIFSCWKVVVPGTMNGFKCMWQEYLEPVVSNVNPNSGVSSAEVFLDCQQQHLRRRKKKKRREVA